MMDAFLSPSVMETGFLTTRYLRAFFDSFTPAFAMAAMKGAAEPSMMGTSGPLMSMWALSMPQP